MSGPLMFAASRGRTGSIKALLAAGGDPAITTRPLDVLERMTIDKEAEACLRDALNDIRKSTPGGTARALTPAEEQKAIEAQRAFLRSQAELEKTLAGFTPESLASEKPSWNTPSGYESKVIISVPPVWETWVRKTGGMTALLHAAREGHIQAALALLDGGADIDQVSYNGSSPLLMALS
jgi:ankyrin repeat protein